MARRGAGRSRWPGGSCAPSSVSASWRGSGWRRRTAAAPPGRAAPRSRRRRGASRRPRPPRHGKDRAPSGSGRSRTAPTGRPSSRRSARLNGTSAGLDDGRRGREVVRGGEHRRPGEQVGDPEARPQLLGEVRRRQAGRAARRRGRRRPRPRNAAGVEIADGRRDEQQAGPVVRRVRVPQPRQRRQPLPAPLDERGAADEEERHVRAEPRRTARVAPRRRASTPHASSAASAAAAASDDPPARPAATGIRLSSRAASGGRRLAAAPLGSGGARGRRRSRAGRGCPASGPGVEARHVEAVRARPAAPPTRTAGPRGRAGPSRCGGRGSRRRACRGPPASG